jgi:predicted ATPase
LDLPNTGLYPRSTLEPQQRRQATLAAFVRYIEALSRRQPLFAVFEDAHWSDATSLELLDILIGHVSRLPILLLITFRPEFEPPWVGLPHSALLLLNRLGPVQTEALAAHVAGDKPLPTEIVERIVEHTDGIPLFVEELTKTLLESGLLRQLDGTYVIEDSLPSLTIPSSLHA